MEFTGDKANGRRPRTGRRVFSTGPSWSPMGLTLLVNQFGGELFLQATYVPDSVPEPLVHDFLDLLVRDLEV